VEGGRVPDLALLVGVDLAKLDVSFLSVGRGSGEAALKFSLETGRGKLTPLRAALAASLAFLEPLGALEAPPRE